MGRTLKSLTPSLIDFINEQKIFFVATAMKEGSVNVSPKGMDTFQVVDSKRAIWLNLTGSGNETATHLKHHDRITIMFCAFEGSPKILRLYGNAKVYHEHDSFWEENIQRFTKISGSRQLIDVTIDVVQISCGMGIPFMDFKGQRDDLNIWAEKQGEEGLVAYRQKKNTISFDGHETGIFEE